ncbi:Inositol polyphosphate-related phosphatase domain-containing protein [Plasmodiophora brassicae]|uniref:Inositol polyphosphate-related phosphatase domain-containing protein n=1 Tax=Plasmodiophora brassicae TaxID=37360 RepID=A0A0G4IUU2_PLABS|nr:hypothetical protein PBRA_007126 [Plasmodiophora brassicae]SPQ98566.1 unnamed protein product [Plasmodiophora brassicae]
MTVDVETVVPADAGASTSGVLEVFVGTWNLHAQTPGDDLSTFIPVGRYDVYAIGTEECGQSMQVAMVYDDKSKWERQLSEHLGPDMALLQSATLNAIHLVVFVRKRLLAVVTDLSSASVATGIGNVIGNKGGVGIAARFGATTIAFVNCHFHAHDSAVEQRNSDYHAINEQLALAGRNGRLTSDAFDVVFWFGDLNYRIEGGRRMIDSLLRHGMLEVMMANEQLAREMRKGAVFAGFLEGPIDFLPSYKFDKNSDVYDSSPKQRVPSWTDRILWRSNRHVTQVKYGSVANLRTSDHRPVYATFRVQCDAPDPALSPSAADKARPYCLVQ